MDDLIAIFAMFIFWILGTLRVFQYLFQKYVYPRLKLRYEGVGKSDSRKLEPCPECGSKTKHHKDCSRRKP